MARHGVATDLDSPDWRTADMPSNGDVTGGRLRSVGSSDQRESARESVSSTARPRRGLAHRLGISRLGVRLVAGVLLVTLPIVTAMALLLTSRSSDALTDASYEKSAGLARAVALRLEDWLRERDHNIVAIANSAGALTGSEAGADALQGLETALGDFRLIAVADAAGEVIVATAETSLEPRAEPWWPQVVAGQPVFTTPTEDAGAIEWVITEPITDADGRVAGAVIGSLDVASLATLLSTGLDDDVEVGLIDGEGRLVYDTEMGRPADDAELLEAGALRWTVANEAIDRARAEGTGTARFTDRDGDDSIGAAATVQGTDWVILAQEQTSDSLAPVRRQRMLATQLGLAAAAIAAVFALLFARSTTRPLRALTSVARRTQRGDLDARVVPGGPEEMRDLARSMNESLDSIQDLIRQMVAAGLQVNSSAAELSAASDELAATTTEQSAAVTQASATTEELARASSVIADTVDEVAAQTADTRSNLEQAEHDIQESSARTTALAGRINEIGALLTLINEIADQTGLLALNAAIEAARAGEEGRGFAVVAEEVRRLADSSKSSAADIERIVDGIHSETSATVMAMEKGAKQMQHGLVLLDQVTGAADHVRLTTQQQRSATAQVVETMDQLTDASRQVAITAQQIAGSASNLASLARNLDESAAMVTGRKRS